MQNIIVHIIVVVAVISSIAMILGRLKYVKQQGDKNCDDGCDKGCDCCSSCNSCSSHNSEKYLDNDRESREKV